MKKKIVVLCIAVICLTGFVGLNILAYNHAHAMTTYVEPHPQQWYQAVQTFLAKTLQR